MTTPPQPRPRGGRPGGSTRLDVRGGGNQTHGGEEGDGALPPYTFFSGRLTPLDDASRSQIEEGLSRGASSFVAIEAARRATVPVDLIKDADVVVPLTAPCVDTGDELVCVGLGDPVQDSVIAAYEALFAVLTQEHGYSKDDAYALMSAVAHTELSGPTGSKDPDPVHPFRSVGQVTLARISKEYLRGGAAHPRGMRGW